MLGQRVVRSVVALTVAAAVMDQAGQGRQDLLVAVGEAQLLLHYYPDRGVGVLIEGQDEVLRVLHYCGCWYIDIAVQSLLYYFTDSTIIQ